MKMVKRRLLWLSLALMVVPGWIGQEMAFAGHRLGLFQPFKILFLSWLVIQTCTVLPALPEFLKKVPFWIYLGGSLWNGGMIAGLTLEGGGPRGWALYGSLVLGQWAALVTLADQEWDTQGVKNGFTAAVALLIAFSVLELFFTDAPVTIYLLEHLRNTGYVSQGAGSLISTSALAEYVMRVLPFFLFGVFYSSRDRWVSAALFLLGFLTLSRSGLLANVGFIALFCVFVVSHRQLSRKWILRAAGAAMGLMVLTVAIKGPALVFGRYFGGLQKTRTSLVPSNQIDYVRDAQQSVEERQNYWSLGVKVLRAYPWTGVGLDGFAERNFRRLHPLEDNPNPEGVHTHNLFLEFAVSGGVFAGLGFLILWWGGLARAIQCRHWQSIAFFMACTFGALTDARIYVSWLAITFAWIPALAWKSKSLI